MAWKPIHFALAAMMVAFGTFNTLSVKWADKMTSESSDGTLRSFDHPFLQACGMFLGEMLCMVAFWILRWRSKRQPQSTFPPIDDGTAPKKFNPLIFLPPALCDMTATSIQYIGLTLTYASSFQMLRGAVIIFTGILSTIFLRRKLQWFKWLGMVFVIGGLVTVGVNDLMAQSAGNSTSTNVTEHTLWSSPIVTAVYGNDTKTNSDLILGDALIFCSQVFHWYQMQAVCTSVAVGWEGTFGFTTLAVLLIPFNYIYVGPKFGANPRMVLEDAYDGVYQLAHNPLLALAFSGTVISIAFFNFAGISVTKELSATTRMVLDSIRTLTIWMFSIAVGWQSFYPLQLLGFAILLSGMCFYNDILIIPGIKKIASKFGLCIEPVPYNNVEDEDEEEQEDVENREPVFSTRGQE
ncbi:solute carrier family 35 member F6 [Eurytemora carolleeae]|uniref:solute carrier family 35 member F6 n=1 Tax=Eurytemora carolleeae TaxID=1294199 RepID=UPI000C75F44B|nr:solute carrier family 35 member F6 [Eurytemora carolleeae]|eukprot:XP_023326441.1 solute carrier family 35 member F6-like [Eurytemora affinis]